MANKREELPQPNTSSTADIAFLLLIFFLVTTSMAGDKGLSTRLPPPVDSDVEQKVEERNTLVVLVSQENKIMCQKREIELWELRDIAKEFIENPTTIFIFPKKFPSQLIFLAR